MDGVTHRVILIHGSFEDHAPDCEDADLDGGQWWHPEGVFSAEIKAGFPKHAEVEVCCHRWGDGGKNTMYARREGATHLRRAIEEYSRSGDQIHLIGYSHGGNVAIGALEHVNADAIIRSVTLVGTPIFERELDADKLEFQSLLLMAGLALFSPLLVLYITLAAWLLSFPFFAIAAPLMAGDQFPPKFEWIGNWTKYFFYFYGPGFALLIAISMINIVTIPPRRARRRRAYRHRVNDMFSEWEKSDYLAQSFPGGLQARAWRGKGPTPTAIFHPSDEAINGLLSVFAKHRAFPMNAALYLRTTERFLLAVAGPALAYGAFVLASYIFVWSTGYFANSFDVLGRGTLLQMTDIVKQWLIAPVRAHWIEHLTIAGLLGAAIAAAYAAFRLISEHVIDRSALVAFARNAAVGGSASDHHVEVSHRFPNDSDLAGPISPREMDEMQSALSQKRFDPSVLTNLVQRSVLAGDLLSAPQQLGPDSVALPLLHTCYFDSPTLRNRVVEIIRRSTEVPLETRESIRPSP